MWHRFKKNRPSPGAVAPALNGPTLSAGAEASVRQLIANGKHKVAVETAKEIHKAQATAARLAAPAPSGQAVAIQKAEISPIARMVASAECRAIT